MNRLWNTMKTTLFLGALTGLFLLIGSAIGGTTGMFIALLLAVGMNMGAWWFSDKLALKMSGARPVTPEEAPQLHHMVETLAQRAGIPKPAVYLIDSPMPNAFATGRSPAKGAVAVTTGIMGILNRDELAGVVAHELAHIKNRDTLISSIAASAAGAISMIGDMLMWGMIFGGFGGNEEEEGGGNMAGGPDCCDSCADCRHHHPDGHFALAGVCGRRRRRPHLGRPAAAGQRAGQAGAGRAHGAG
jgi:heat shock protein HtpX